MKGALPSILFLFLSIANAYTLRAQSDRGDVAAWLLPGVSWQPSSKFRLLGQPGYNSYYRAGLGYIQGFITIHKNIVLNPGYMYYIRKTDKGAHQHSHFLMNAVTPQIQFGSFLLDNRNMLWIRTGTDIEPLYYYRNRFRLVKSFHLADREAKLYGYNEAFRLLNNGTWTRNRFAAGTSYDILPHANVDVTYIRQWDRTGGWLHLFFIMATWRLPSGK
ncbi:DUF2490 domain-containing protein [Chitinophaga sp. S165]|uniref:DUF2490 domain-containing protein n=1 Tax=Chitinophaga sp. S165 TaxID=2135462 RepID=UPI000D710179|nr:DUF2490 domain-containing protein [Chitinophaga sp. S165]PWV54455.1 uncharacterized protein DUF2490 [Chitinophaga sp. S165]